MSITRALLPRLATSEPVLHTLTVTARTVDGESITGGSQFLTDLPAPTSWTLTFDETRRPYASGTLTYPTSVYDWATLDPADRTTLTRVRLEVGYTWPATAETYTDQLAVLIITAIESDDESATTTLTVESDEVLLDWDRVAPGASYQVTAQSGQIDQIMTAAQAAAGALYPLPIQARAVIPAANTDAVYALELAEGDNWADWAWTLAEAAGLWLHSDQETTSNGGLIAENRPPARLYGLDLRTTAPYQLVLRRRHKRTSDDAASHLDLTVNWTENGEDLHLTRRYTATSSTALRVASRDLRMRPPLVGGVRTLPDAWPPAQALADRIAQRTWTQDVQARSAYWLRPRDSVLTDRGPAVIASITFDGDTGLMTLQARPY